MEHRVSFDCASKRVTLRYDNDIVTVMNGERRDYLSNVISALVHKMLVWKGCEAYLTYVSDSNPTKLCIQDIQTVRGFLDVFPEDLSGIPLNREVEFGIELLLGTALASITPYRTESKELMKLKA